MKRMWVVMAVALAVGAVGCDERAGDPMRERVDSMLAAGYRLTDYECDCGYIQSHPDAAECKTSQRKIFHDAYAAECVLDLYQSREDEATLFIECIDRINIQTYECVDRSSCPEDRPQCAMVLEDCFDLVSQDFRTAWTNCPRPE